MATALLPRSNDSGYALPASILDLAADDYWEIGRRIVEFEQGGRSRAEYGERVLERLALDLTSRFGRGFSLRNLRSFRMFYLAWPIRQTLSAESSQTNGSTLSSISSTRKSQTLSTKCDVTTLAARFPLPWSHYVRLLSVDNPQVRSFYEVETVRGGSSPQFPPPQVAQ